MKPRMLVSLLTLLLLSQPALAGIHANGDVELNDVRNGFYLKVDLALPQWGTDVPWPGTAKDGWWHWAAPQWADMYGQEGVWEDGSMTKPTGPGIGNLGVHAFITCGYEGEGGLLVFGMHRCGWRQCSPTGWPFGDPIANSWYSAIDRAGTDAGDILLLLTDLPPGQYELISFHNHWETCWRMRDYYYIPSKMPPMPSITAEPLPSRPLPEYRDWSLPIGTGTGVTAIQNAYDVKVTSVYEDDEVSTSLVAFETDGSDVLIIYEAPDWGFPDCARPGREGGSGTLNAFELVYRGRWLPYDPSPTDGAVDVPTDTVLSWRSEAEPLWRDVYLGTDYDAVSNATDPNTPPGRGRHFKESFEQTYDPDSLKLGQRYYWRIDVVDEGNKNSPWKGPVWTFTTTNTLRVDLALPLYWDTRTPWPGTAKEGWWPWFAWRWDDMWAHDCVWECDSQCPAGIASSGIHALISCGYEGQGGLHAKDLCRSLADYLYGHIQGEPIANTWYYAVDRAGPQWGDIVLVLTDLPPGRYELTGYHNHWERGPGQSNRYCCRCEQRMPPMPSITAQSLPAPSGDGHCRPPGKDMYRGLCLCGTGTGVTPIQNAYDVPVTYVYNDEEVSTSLIEFATDGSEVLIIYEAPDWGFPDCIWGDREGGRGVLNAFELVFVSPLPPACWDYPAQCHGDSDDSGDVKSSDFVALKNSWFKCYPDPDYNPCSDFDRDGCVKGSDFLILKSNWFQTVANDCPPGGTWPPEP